MFEPTGSRRDAASTTTSRGLSHALDHQVTERVVTDSTEPELVVATSQNLEQQPRGGSDDVTRLHQHRSARARRLQPGHLEHGDVVRQLDQPDLGLKFHPRVQTALTWAFILRQDWRT